MCDWNLVSLFMTILITFRYRSHLKTLFHDHKSSRGSNITGIRRLHRNIYEYNRPPRCFPLFDRVTRFTGRWIDQGVLTFKIWRRWRRPHTRFDTYTRIHVYGLYTGRTSLRTMEGEASGVRRNARNWNDQLFDSRGASLGANFPPSPLPLSLSLFSLLRNKLKLSISQLAVAMISKTSSIYTFLNTDANFDLNPPTDLLPRCEVRSRLSASAWISNVGLICA